ncbi:MAG TPA: aspartate/glutamate racemase family protein [Solirubrobacterales bacterium]|nr:aspartate/glutamate racemase family protein [Solirubrobacterales bacterium]
MRIANVLPVGMTGYEPPQGSTDAEVEVVEMAFHVFPANAVDMLLTEATVLEATLKAAEAGFDAVFVNSTSDYGLKAARAAVSIPVVGAGLASMTLACNLGQRFGIVSVWPEAVREIHERQLRDYQLGERCASMRFVTSEDELSELDQETSFYTEMRARKPRMVDRIAAAVERSVEEDGSDAIVLGCTCMSPVAAELAARTKVPVIDPLAAGFATTELLARLSLSHSPAAHRPAPTRRNELVAGMVAAATASLAAAELVEEDCGPYCAISPAGEARPA